METSPRTPVAERPAPGRPGKRHGNRAPEDLGPLDPAHRDRTSGSAHHAPVVDDPPPASAGGWKTPRSGTTSRPPSWWSARRVGPPKGERGTETWRKAPTLRGDPAGKTIQHTRGNPARWPTDRPTTSHDAKSERSP